MLTDTDPLGRQRETLEGDREGRRRKATKRTGSENEDSISWKQCSRELQEGGNDKL